MSCLLKTSLADYKEKEANKILADYEEFTYTKGSKCLRDRMCGKILLLFSVINFIIGILLVTHSIFDMLLEERTKMRPGLPAMENWRNPKTEILVKVYVYGIENPKEFQKGIDKKIKLYQVGPIIYRHNVRQEDIVFEDDGTLSYTTVRDFQFLEEENEPGILNKSITVINPMMVSLASKTGNYFVQYLDDVYINRTVYDVLWNGSTKLLDFFRSHFSFVLPTDNFGILYNSFKKIKERYNVRIGSENNFQDFWKINTINGKTKLANYENINGYDGCPFSVVNTTDGTGFPPYITKNHKFKVATARVPRYFNMEFEEEAVKNNIEGYKFIITNENYMRTYDEKDCLGNYKNIELPDGVIDASAIAYDNPLGFSPPHFYGFTGEWENYLEGLSPNKEDHQSYLLLEPKTGLPLEGYARLQGNNIVGDLSGWSKLRAFSNKIIPQFWIEQGFDDIGFTTEIYFVVYILPVLQVITTIIFFLLSMWCFYAGARNLLPSENKNMKFWNKVTNSKPIESV